MSHDDLMWLSGFLEGEGCFTWASRVYKGKRYKYPKVEVRNCDHDVMERARRLIGGKTLYVHIDKRFGGRAKPLFSATVSGPKATALMKELYPYMGIRRKGRIDGILSAGGRVCEDSMGIATR